MKAIFITSLSIFLGLCNLQSVSANSKEWIKTYAGEVSSVLSYQHRCQVHFWEIKGSERGLPSHYLIKITNDLNESIRDFVALETFDETVKQEVTGTLRFPGENSHHDTLSWITVGIRNRQIKSVSIRHGIFEEMTCSHLRPFASASGED